MHNKCFIPISEHDQCPLCRGEIQGNLYFIYVLIFLNFKFVAEKYILSRKNMKGQQSR